MTIADFGLLIIEHKAIVTALVILILSSIEILPIKLNPWSWIAGCIRKLNGMELVEKKIDSLSTAMIKLENKVDEGQAIQSRVRILRFGDELRNQTPKSKDSYDQVLDDITRYNLYCESHPDFKNDMTVLTSKIIEEKYVECLRDNIFL